MSTMNVGFSAKEPNQHLSSFNMDVTVPYNCSTSFNLDVTVPHQVSPAKGWILVKDVRSTLVSEVNNMITSINTIFKLKKGLPLTEHKEQWLLVKDVSSTLSPILERIGRVLSHIGNWVYNQTWVRLTKGTQEQVRPVEVTVLPPSPTHTRSGSSTPSPKATTASPGQLNETKEKSNNMQASAGDFLSLAKQANKMAQSGKL